MEKAETYGAHSVFFDASRNGRPPVAQAFVFVSDGSADNTKFAELHKRLWSWAVCLWFTGRRLASCSFSAAPTSLTLYPRLGRLSASQLRR
jgi:hypothetical protein